MLGRVYRLYGIGASDRIFTKSRVVILLIELHALLVFTTLNVINLRGNFGLRCVAMTYYQSEMLANLPLSYWAYRLDKRIFNRLPPEVDVLSVCFLVTIVLFLLTILPTTCAFVEISSLNPWHFFSNELAFNFVTMVRSYLFNYLVSWILKSKSIELQSMVDAADLSCTEGLNSLSRQLRVLLEGTEDIIRYPMKILLTKYFLSFLSNMGVNLASMSHPVEVLYPLSVEIVKFITFISIYNQAENIKQKISDFKSLVLHRTRHNLNVEVSVFLLNKDLLGVQVFGSVLGWKSLFSFLSICYSFSFMAFQVALESEKLVHLYNFQEYESVGVISKICSYLIFPW